MIKIITIIGISLFFITILTVMFCVAFIPTKKEKEERLSDINSGIPVEWLDDL